MTAGIGYEPSIKEFWLERPTRDARETTLYALLDSASVTGAYSFVVQPAERTSVNRKRS